VGGGPLTGLRIIELVGIGPGPYAAMLLSDLGAEVIRLDRPESVASADDRQRREIVNRGRRSVAINLKSPAGQQVLLDLLTTADALLDPFRPGVTERMGIGPDVCLLRRPSLVYGRVTGWGQRGPLAGHAGHDINYVALAGALAHIGRAGEPPTPPLNLVGDMGGGGLLLAFGVVCALLEAQRSGRGQVVDAAMVDGAASLMTMVRGYREMGFYSAPLGANVLDSGAPFYDVYECADGRYISIGPVEFRFWANLLRAVGLDIDSLPPRKDPDSWPLLKQRLSEVFAQRSRDEWSELLAAETELCFAPVLDLDEAPHHPHNRARETFVTVDALTQPGPVPRFSRTPGAIQRPPGLPGGETVDVLTDWIGDDQDRWNRLRAEGVVA
jgi:alpha-methylacyl-CoA racemase